MLFWGAGCVPAVSGREAGGRPRIAVWCSCGCDRARTQPAWSDSEDQTHPRDSASQQLRPVVVSEVRPIDFRGHIAVRQPNATRTRDLGILTLRQKSLELARASLLVAIAQEERIGESRRKSLVRPGLAS